MLKTKLIVGSALVILISSLFLASCETDQSPFDPQAWDGTYELMNADCKTEVSFLTPDGQHQSARFVNLAYAVSQKPRAIFANSLTLTASTTLAEDAQRTSDVYYNLNGESYFSRISCLSEGTVSQTTVTATGTTIRVKVDKLQSNLLCLPTDVVKSSTETKLAERHGDYLSIYGCIFKKI